MSVVAPAMRSRRVGRAGEGGVRRLRHRDPLVLGLLEQVHEPQAVLRQQHAVGVERQDVVGVGHVEIRCAGR